MQNIKYGTDESIYKTETNSDIENRLVFAGGGGGEVGWMGNLSLVDVNNYIQNR